MTKIWVIIQYLLNSIYSLCLIVHAVSIGDWDTLYMTTDPTRWIAVGGEDLTDRPDGTCHTRMWAQAEYFDLSW